MPIQNNSLNSFITSIGFKVFLIYVFFTYVPQVFFHIILNEEFSKLYVSSFYNPFLVWLYIICIVFLLITLNTIIPSIKTPYYSSNIQRIFSYLSTLFIFIYFLMAIYFSINYGIDFRHNYRMRDAGFIIQIMFFFKQFIYMYVFFKFIDVLNGQKISIYEKVKLFIILVSWVLTNVSSVETIMIFIIALLLIDHHKINILFKKNRKVSQILLYGVSLFFIIFAVIFIGLMTKYDGIEGTLRLFSNYDIFINKTVVLVITRISISFESLLLLLNTHFVGFQLGLDSVSGFINTFFSRLSYVLPVFEYKLDDIETINRMNYVLLMNEELILPPRAGASPGLLGSTFYLPFFPINILMTLLYIIIILRLFNKYLSGVKKEINFISYLILFYFIVRFFEAPFDLFYIINPTNVALVILVFGIMNPKYKTSKVCE